MVKESLEVSIEGNEDSWRVHVANHTIYAVSTHCCWTLQDWLKDILPRCKRYKFHLIGICAYKGVRNRYSTKGPKSNPLHPSNPYCTISLCLGGSDVLIFQKDRYCDLHELKTLRNLLLENKVITIGLVLNQQLAQKLETDLCIQFARPVDLRDVAKRAMGREVWEKKEGQKGRAMETFGLEEMAEVVMEGIHVEKPGQYVVEANWEAGNYGDELEEEMANMHAVRDAYLSFEMGFKCLERLDSAWRQDMIWSINILNGMIVSTK